MHPPLVLFILIALLMVVAPLLVLALNFLRRHAVSADEATRRRENIGAAKARLAALEGGGDTLSEDERAAYQDEVKRQLLADTAAGEGGSAGGEGEGTDAAPPESRASILTGIALCAVLLCMAPVIYLFIGTPQAVLPPPPPPPAPTMENISRMVDQLQKRVEQNPDDGEGLRLLAASLMVLQRPSEAADYYGRARALLGDEPRLLAGQLEALMAVEERAAEVPPLLETALAAAPDEPYFLWLAGAWARKNGDLERALSYFNSVAVLLEDPDALRDVEAIIAEIEQEISAAETTPSDKKSQ